MNELFTSCTRDQQPGSLREYMKRKRSLFSSAFSVSRHAPPKRSLMPPRVAPDQGYTGLCAACLRAAVISHGSRRRAASGSSSRHRRTSDESFLRTLARHASPRLCTGCSASAAWWAWRTQSGRALPSLAGPEDARERRTGQSREGLPTHHRMPRRPRESKRVVAIVTLPQAMRAPRDSQTR